MEVTALAIFAYASIVTDEQTGFVVSFIEKFGQKHIGSVAQTLILILIRRGFIF